MSKKIITLDAGHSLSTAGRRTSTGVREWTMNNNVCNYVAQYLSNYDVSVVRLDDTSGKTDIPLAKRLSKAKSLKPIACISVHHNAGKGTGVEAYVRDVGARKDSIDLAKMMVVAISTETGLRNRGQKSSNFYMCTVCDFPTILVEGGFMDTSLDVAIITSESGQMAYARGIAQSLIKFFGLKETTDSIPTPSQLTPTPTNPVAKVIANTLNVRSGYGTNHGVIRQLGKGNLVDVLESYTNGWSIINIDGQIGYVNHSYLSVHKTPLVDVGSVSSAPTRKRVVPNGKIKIKNGARQYNRNQGFASWVYTTTYDVISINGNRVVFGVGRAITGVVHLVDCIAQ